MFMNPPYLEEGGIHFDDFIAGRFHVSLLCEVDWSRLHSLPYHAALYPMGTAGGLLPGSKAAGA
jgi:hypothetical protein